MHLTSGVPYQFRLDNMGELLLSGQLWDMLVHAHASGTVMAACALPPMGLRLARDILPSGLLVEQLYPILDVQLLAGQHRLIKLRNSRGKGQWRGDWSDKSPLWTDALRREAGEDSGAHEASRPQGEHFWMSFADFAANFHRLYPCRNFAADMRASIQVPKCL
jgi:hypothetical protein